MKEQLTFDELCLIGHCLNRKAELIIKEFQKENGWLYGSDVPKNIDEMCNKLRALTAVMRKVDKMSLEACEKESK